jgi:tRNA (guanosine-2'-O-)-methyltransferase
MSGPTPARLSRLRAAAQERTRRLILVLEDVHKARNLGALLRTCDALGIQEIHAIENRSPAAEDGETSMGAGRWLDVIRHRRADFPDPARLYPPEVAREPAALDNTRRVLLGLRARGYRLAVADLAPGAVGLDQAPLDQALALVIGNEFTGPSPVALELADLRLVIPMRGLAQSLNLSVFAGIALHALSERMRSQPGWGLTAAEQAELVRRWSGSPA